MELGGTAERRWRERAPQYRELTISGEGCRWWRRLIDATAAPPPPAFPPPFSLRRLYSAIPLPLPLPALSHDHPSGFHAPFLFYPLSVFSLRVFSQHTMYAPTERIAPLIPSLRYPLPFLFSYPPHSLQRLLSNPLVSSRRCTTHVLTEQHTSDLRGESVRPSSAHATLSRRGSFRRKHLTLLSRLSRRLSSRLETVRCAGDPGTIHLEHPGSLVAMACRFTTRWTQDSRVQIKVLSFRSFRPTPLLLQSAAAGSF